MPISWSLSLEQVADFHEPEVSTPPVRLCAPPLKSLASMMERLKGLDSKILLRANMMGELSIGIETGVHQRRKHIFYQDYRIRNAVCRADFWLFLSRLTCWSENVKIWFFSIMCGLIFCHLQVPNLCEIGEEHSDIFFSNTDGGISQTDRSKQGEVVIDAVIFSKLLASYSLRPDKSFCCKKAIACKAFSCFC